MIAPKAGQVLGRRPESGPQPTSNIVLQQKHWTVDTEDVVVHVR